MFKNYQKCRILALYQQRTNRSVDEHSIVGRHSGELKIFAVRVLDEIDQFLFNLE